MARSQMVILAIGVLFFSALSAAKTITKDYNITWVLRNPDGMFMRPVQGVNGEWPIPTIEATKGDRILINVHNQLGNQSTSLHFHGIFQNRTTHMDGVAGVSQCKIPPGSKFTYDFTLDQSGTYWYHSHETGQYPDGLRSPFIVHDLPGEAPDFMANVDEEIVLPLGDWYHDQMAVLLPQFLSYINPTGAEPVPNAALMNNTQNVTISVEPNKTYLFRLVNQAAFAAQYFWFEGHTMQIVEVDGVYTKPQDAEMIYITAAQRYGVLVTTKSDASKNFAIVGSMDQSLFDVVPPGLNTNVTGWLVYNEKAEKPAATPVANFDASYDDFNLIPYDEEPLFEEPTQRFELTMKMGNLGNGVNYAFINDHTYVGPKVPSVWTALSTGNMSTDVTVYGSHTNSFMLKHNQVVEIVLNNNDPGKHPFHLHGHNFQAVVRSADNAGYYARPANVTDGLALPKTPMRRDTFMVPPNGHYAIRFRSDNPGVWLFHCHLEWHVAAGLTATFVEAPDVMTETLETIPQDHYEACRAGDIPFKGNAAGNTKQLLNLQGEPSPPPPLPAGFTARGIVALVFSCIAAFLGMAVIAWYGAAPLGKSEFAAAKRRIDMAER